MAQDEKKSVSNSSDGTGQVHIIPEKPDISVETFEPDSEAYPPDMEDIDALFQTVTNNVLIAEESSTDTESDNIEEFPPELSDIDTLFSTEETIGLVEEIHPALEKEPETLGETDIVDRLLPTLEDDDSPIDFENFFDSDEIIGLFGDVPAQEEKEKPFDAEALSAIDIDALLNELAQYDSSTPKPSLGIDKDSIFSSQIEKSSKPDEALYTRGGTISSTGKIYINRSADNELYENCVDGKLSFVLTARQMGKSSLMVQTVARLRKAGIRDAIIDLTAGVAGESIGSIRQFYLAFLTVLTERLELDIKVKEWWQENEDAGSDAIRFSRFLRDVLLNVLDEPIVIFIDEIDSIRSLKKKDFPVDDFFAVIRAIYNERAIEPIYNRLTFVLLGVARPSDLIDDYERTPFNIGIPIQLEYFSYEEALQFGAGLGMTEEAVKPIIGRILEWTAGHPYQTQLICWKLAQNPQLTRRLQNIDQLVSDTFLRARNMDSNLQFVADWLSRPSDRVSILRQYYEVSSGREVTESDTESPILEYLKITGIIRPVHGIYYVSNRIYYEYFNSDWINSVLGLHSLVKVADWENQLAGEGSGSMPLLNPPFIAKARSTDSMQAASLVDLSSDEIAQLANFLDDNLTENKSVDEIEDGRLETFQKRLPSDRNFQPLPQKQESYTRDEPAKPPVSEQADAKKPKTPPKLKPKAYFKAEWADFRESLIDGEFSMEDILPDSTKTRIQAFLAAIAKAVLSPFILVILAPLGLLANLFVAMPWQINVAMIVVTVSWAIRELLLFFLKEAGNPVNRRLAYYTLEYETSSYISWTDVGAEPDSGPLRFILRRLSLPRWDLEGYLDQLKLETVQSGIGISVGSLLIYSGLVSAMTGAVAFIITGPTVLAGLAVPAFFIPYIVVLQAGVRRNTLFQQQLPTTLQMWVNGLRSGYSVVQAMEAISREANEPTASELKLAINEVQLGRNLSEALDDLVNRVPSTELDLAVTSMHIQREVGGNLAEILEINSHLIRERIKIRSSLQWNFALIPVVLYWLLVVATILSYTVLSQLEINPERRSAAIALYGLIGLLCAISVIITRISSFRALMTVRSGNLEKDKKLLTLNLITGGLLAIPFAFYFDLPSHASFGLVALYALLMIPGVWRRLLRVSIILLVVSVVVSLLMVLSVQLNELRQQIDSSILSERNPTELILISIGLTVGVCLGLYWIQKFWQNRDERSTPSRYSAIINRVLANFPYNFPLLYSIYRGIRFSFGKLTLLKFIIEHGRGDNLRDSLYLASGYNGPYVELEQFRRIQWIITIITALVVFALCFLLQIWLSIPQLILLFVIGIGLSIALPFIYLYDRVFVVRRQIEDDFPDALDLMVVCVEAGLGFDAAMGKVYEKWDSVLALQFGRIIQEIQLGKPRRDSLRDRARVIKVAAFNEFAAMIIQADQLGVSIGRILRIESDRLRSERQMRYTELLNRFRLRTFLLFYGLLVFSISTWLLFLVLV